MYTQQTLSHRDALQIIATIQLKLEEDQKGAAIAVVDAHGELIAFLRTDGCRLPSITIAINKAYTAAREQIASKELGERSKSKEDGFPMTNFGELRYVSWGGGFPIVVNGETVGAVGVSGLPEEDDMVIAQQGITAFLTDLEV